MTPKDPREFESKIRQIQLSCLGALLALLGSQYLMHYATKHDCIEALYGAMACVVVLYLFARNIRSIVRSI